MWTSYLPEPQFPPLQIRLFVPSSQSLIRTGLDKASDTPSPQQRIEISPFLPLVIPSLGLDPLVLLSKGPGSMSGDQGPSHCLLYLGPSNQSTEAWRWMFPGDSLSMASHCMEGKAEARRGGRVLSKAVLHAHELKT